MEIAKEVLAGVGRLDERGPKDWRSRVNPDTLDCMSQSRCLLAQVFGDFGAGVKALGLTLWDIGRPDHFWNYGFCSAENDEHWRNALA